MSAFFWKNRHNKGKYFNLFGKTFILEIKLVYNLVSQGPLNKFATL